MLLREAAVSDAPHGHSSGRILRVMKAHWAPPLLCVWPFGGVSLPGYLLRRRACFQPSNHFGTASFRLLWLLLTSARSPGMLPCEAQLSDLESRKAGQISPDKNVNCRYTTAAFTISPESMGLRHGVLTCPDDGLVCCFCTSAHSFALRLPPDPSSRRRPCLRLVLGIPCLTTVIGF